MIWRSAIFNSSNKTRTHKKKKNNTILNLIIVNKKYKFYPELWSTDSLSKSKRLSGNYPNLIKHLLHALRYLDYLITILMLSAMAGLTSPPYYFYWVPNNNNKKKIVSSARRLAQLSTHTIYIFVSLHHDKHIILF